MKKYRREKKLLLFSGLFLVALSLTSALLMFLLRYNSLWVWYDDIKDILIKIEDYITSLDKAWEFVGAIMLLYFIKSFFPIYLTSTVCFLTGVVFPTYIAVPVSIVGIALQITVKYFWGEKLGAGYAWRIVSKYEPLKNLIKSDGKGNPILLALLRLVPCMPVNVISAIYGSFNFGYLKCLLISVVAFIPKIISFTFVGRNLFDPLSIGFLLPVFAISFLSGVCCLGANGVWNIVEKAVSDYNSKKKRKEEVPDAQ